MSTLTPKLWDELTQLRDLAPTVENTNSVKAGAFNAFVNFGDIKAESTDKDHENWVVVI